MAVVDKPSARETKRLQTRERLMGAAIAEFKRSGIAAADVGAIVTAAGVAHGTFFFHLTGRWLANCEVAEIELAREPA